MTPEILDIIEIAGPILGALLTLTVFSYLVGDNPLYRLALHLFVGVLVGYSIGVMLREVLLKMALGQLQSNPILLVPLAMGLWLFFFKSIPRLAYVGNFSVAYIVGVGTAVALSGALLGTIVPQVRATGHALGLASSYRLGPLDSLMIIFGTIFTLMVFNFTFTAQARGGLAGVLAQAVGAIARLGRLFLILAFGVAFAGALTASLSIFIGRIQYLIDIFDKVYPYIAGG